MKAVWNNYILLMRLHRPLPILLLLWPTYWALWVAEKGVPSAKILIIFTLGVLLMRTAGCIFNDIADRNFDGNVERTKGRPLATGAIKTQHAVILGLGLCLLAFCLVLMLNTLTILLSFVAVLLALIYPLCKRFFAVPQFVLGLAFNFGVIMAFAAVLGHVPWFAWLLYGAAIVWTLAYDTTYALADLPYDKKLGLQSSAVLFGRFVLPMIILLQALMLVCLVAFGVQQHFNWVYYVGLVVTIGFYFYQYHLYKSYELLKSIQAFSNNHWVGLIIFIGILCQYPILSQYIR